MNPVRLEPKHTLNRQVSPYKGSEHTVFFLARASQLEKSWA